MLDIKARFMLEKARFMLDFLPLRHYKEYMSTLLSMSSLLALSLLLSSCGSCDCNSPSEDYLRDLPVSRVKSF